MEDKELFPDAEELVGSLAFFFAVIGTVIKKKIKEKFE